MTFAITEQNYPSVAHPARKALMDMNKSGTPLTKAAEARSGSFAE